MKNIENENTWETFFDVLGKLDLSNVQAGQAFRSNSNSIMTDDVKKKVLAEMDGLATYTYKRNIETGTISETQLLRMEGNGEIVGSHIFSRIARYYYLQEKTTERDYSKERILCNTIHAYLGNGYYFLPKGEIVRKVFELGTKLWVIQEYDFIHNDYLEEIVKAIGIIQSYGIDVTILYGSVDCNEKINNEIFELLEKKVISIGGLALLIYLGERYFFDNYIPQIDRYMVTREVENKQSIPIQILLTLAIKHLTINDKNYHKKYGQCNEIVALAQAWYDILDIEGESGMEYAMCKPSNYPLELFNQMLVDKFCVPKQYNKKYILSSLDHMIKPLFLKCDKKYSYSDYRKVANYLMNQPCFICVIDVEQMKKQLDVANYKIDLILDDISILSRFVNSDYTKIDSPCNHYKWPLIQFPMNRYVYIDYHICGFGFYNVVYEMIKEKDSLIDREQGEFVEKMLKDELEKKRYSFLSGKYSALDKRKLNGSECDLVFQDKNTFFVELKKTPITSELENIDDVTLLQQLAKGMVKAQKQCYSHELYLKLNGSICLYDKGREHILLPTSEQDSYFKISVCHQEYSFLTSKNFCTSLLETILLGKFEVKDQGRQGDLDELNKLGAKIMKIISRNKGKKQILIRDEVFYSLFCSLQQILTALWNSEDERDFLGMIKEWIYCQDKSLDSYLQIVTHIYYRENPDKTNLKREIIEMFERTDRKCMYIG